MTENTTTAAQAATQPEALRCAEWLEHIAQGGEVVSIKELARTSAAQLRLLHTALAAPAAQEAAGTVYVEARECGACGHVGINDAPDTSACTHCEWHGPSPTEDLCPGCGQKGAMTTACPECGHRTTCLAIAHLPVTRSDAAAQEAEPARVVAHRMLRRNSFGEWVDEGRYWVDGPAPDELVQECLKLHDTFRIQNAYSEPEPRPQADAGAAPAAPKGWRLVPVDPTEQMEMAGRQHAVWGLPSNAALGYRAMLAAAPQAPAAAPNCQRCSGSGEDPEGYYDQSKGDAGHTHDGPCRTCGGSGQAPAAATESVLIDGVAYSVPAAVAGELLRLHMEALAAPAAAVAPAGLPVSQEPKYTTNGTHLVNRHSGESVPHDEPLFVFRARDALGVRALGAYLELIGEREPSSQHAAAVRGRIADFQRFAAEHPDRMKWPDTAATAAAPTQEAEDAARYRWLRDVSVPPHNFYLSVPDEFKDERYTPAQVDAAIDAARARQEGGGAA